MNAVRIGFIGVGQIAKSHLKKYAEIEDADVVVACDVDEDQLARTCERFEVPERCTDFRELLERDDIDAVDVCLHNNLHAPVSIAAMQAGKHVYCEKPIAGSYCDGVSMIEAAKETGKMLHIQLGSLFSNEAKAAKRLIDDGHLGRLYHARATGYRRRGRPFVDGYGTDRFVKKEMAGGGALYDMAIYHIAQVFYLLGCPEVKRISGATYQETEMDPGRRQSSGYNVEELGLGLVRFADGATLDIIESWAIHMDPFSGSYIAGSKGGIRLAPFKYFSTLSDMTTEVSFNLGSEEYRFHQLNPDYAAYDSSQHHWIAALQGKVPLLPTAEIALQTMLIQEGIYMSQARGEEVSADEVREHSISAALTV